MVKILITTIQVNFVPLVFTIAFLRAALFFTAWLFWIRFSLLVSSCLYVTGFWKNDPNRTLEVSG